ncbi:hypothetical protein BOTBODRAFT_198612 [Botryobasidium botryosum FD-172 SS1]|uniref:Uncharacterized protein n=1 Tax=Botryobasidium botryosum (strain FD-172 SS1) TaxID=930990 RepID=A0A067N313_BOTB1|nr:hypothetical protein BOTBODRAFT_198612 [Botryobasidium botryosum FD-172 SS1]
MNPLIPPFLHFMPPPLQILSVGSGMCVHFPSFRLLTLSLAAAIVAAKAFWLQPGKTEAAHITASSKHYIQSGIVEQVRAAILEAFQDNPGPYDTSKGLETLQQVVLKNYKSKLCVL